MLVAVVPVVLVAVAALSIFRFHEYRQSSWQGVGFGMFATYDNRISRFTRVDVEVDGDVTRVDPRSAFPDLVDRGEVTPSGGAPRELAEAVRERLDADRVVVEIWRIDVEGAGGAAFRLSIEPIRRVEAR